jgi:hypothetical protein
MYGWRTSKNAFISVQNRSQRPRGICSMRGQGRNETD